MSNSFGETISFPKKHRKNKVSKTETAQILNLKPRCWVSYVSDCDSFNEFGLLKGETLYFDRVKDFEFNDGDFILAWLIGGGCFYGFGYQLANSLAIRRLLYRIIPKSKIKGIGILINPILQNVDNAF